MGKNWGNAVCTKWGVQWRKLKHLLFESDYLIINWSDYDKGRLLFIFGMLSQVSVLKWCIMNFYYSTNRIWFNPSALKLQDHRRLYSPTQLWRIGSTQSIFQKIFKFQTVF
ncbi:hypothetical protein M5F66_14510 [Acinetobacter sp. ANC 5033]|uniref:hypothetical protein n=1 Tax=Acinetobacter amyesii TaxID=2942470 RepID=UPI00201B4BF9|nr:hypothetical protein [Acinetobacter amyesii]MCL6239517.1 hypothetical protein [Acinetobacter amyesii]